MVARKKVVVEAVAESGSDSDASISEMLGLGGDEVDSDAVEGPGDSDNEDELANDNEEIDEADDDQLRLMFAAGQLDQTVSMGTKPGKVAREPYLNVAGLEQRLADIKYPADMHWVQRMDVTSSEPIVIENIDDDTERELAFYKQALEAAGIARTRLIVNEVPVDRPVDYFAEMVKSDEHMKRVRLKLIEERENLEKSQNAKRQRELKKFGKEIEKQVLDGRNKQKKEDLESIKKLRKSRKNAVGNNEEENEDIFNVSVENDANNRKRKGEEKDSTGGFKRSKPSFKKQQNDAKFGYGGSKRHAKSNTRESTDESGFNPKKMKQPMKGMPKKGGKKSRPGKARRNKN
eukprot:CFRG2425T1